MNTHEEEQSSLPTTSGDRVVCAQRIEKPPPFYKDDPDLWFAVVENALSFAGITRDQAKFQYIVSNADHTFIPIIADLIKSPPATCRYDAIKTRIIAAFAEPINKRLSRLLSGIPIGEKRPSHYLQELRSLASGHLGEEVLKSLFLAQLAPTIRMSLLCREEDSLDKLAFLADKLQETNVTTQMSVARQETFTLSTIVEEVTELKSKVDELCKLSKYQSLHLKNNGGSSSDTQRSKFYKQKKDKVCYYHFKFGANARRCVQPCCWSLEKNSEN